MANLQKHRTHESLNIETAGEWSVQSRVQIDASGGVQHNTSNVSEVSQIGFYGGADFYIRFDNLSSNTIDTDTDLIIPGETLAFLNVPRGIGDTVYAHFQIVTATAADVYVRLVHL